MVEELEGCVVFEPAYRDPEALRGMEGFDRLSQFYVYYNHPYYLDHMARLGFVKEVDWVEYLIHVPDAVPPRMEKIVSYTKQHLSLKLAEIRIARQLLDESPVLLLDDVLSELDLDRQKFLVSEIDDVQLFITSAELNEEVIKDLRGGTLFRIEEGTVTRVDKY